MRSRSIMLELTAQRLREVMSKPLVAQGEPPPLPTAWERALARRDLPRVIYAGAVRTLVQPSSRREADRAVIDAASRELAFGAIDRGW